MATTVFNCASGKTQPKECVEGPNDILGKCIDTCVDPKLSKKQILNEISCYISYEMGDKVCDRTVADKKKNPVCFPKGATLESLYSQVMKHFQKQKNVELTYMDFIKQTLLKLYGCTK